MKQIVILFFFFFLITSRSAGQTIEIGNQQWSNTNLATDHFANGSPIPQASTANEWKTAGEKKQPAWCYYGFDANNGYKYGKLYNFYAVADPRGLCPTGWHVPTAEEWYPLSNEIERPSFNLKSKSGWSDGNNGKDTFGFSALPAGQCTSVNTVQFILIGVAGYWWSSSDDRAGTCCIVKDTYRNHSEVYDKAGKTCCAKVFQIGIAEINGEPKDSGCSVRCIKNQ